VIATGKTHWGFNVFDANGVQLHGVTWCDTETGEAVHLVKDDKGFVRTFNEEGKDVVKTEWRQHPSPLLLVRAVNAGKENA
jgi:hypothetical protein